jgi:DNA-binding HxlR family transcriptional regulator
VKLRRPTDFLILEALDEHGRNVAANVHRHIDKGRKNVNVRLPELADYGLVEKIGPNERSGLYELTDQGRVVLQLRDQYGEVEDFEALVKARASRQGRGEVATDGGQS